MKGTCLLVAVAVAFPASALHGQHSSTVPGVPSASIPFHGARQSRTSFDLSLFRVEGAAGDSLTARALLGYGRSYRVRSNWEIGYDVTFAEGVLIAPPQDSVNEGLEDSSSPNLRGTFLYGLRVGAKLRPISFVSPDGNGFDVAVAASYQPSLKPAFSASTDEDSIANEGGEDEAAADLSSAVHAGISLGLLMSYRSDRLLVDAGLLNQSVSQTEGSPLNVYSGFAPRIGLMYRVSGSLSAGLSWWSSGEPPWYNAGWRPQVEETASVAAVLSFGSRPEAGTDLIITSPSGSITESVRLYVRFRDSF